MFEIVLFASVWGGVVGFWTLLLPSHFALLFCVFALVVSLGLKLPH